MTFKKEYIIYGVLGLAIILLAVNGEIIRSKYKRAHENLLNQVEEYAELKKEKDGLYSDLVDTNASNKSLNDSLKKSSDENRLLYKRIRKDNEKIITLEKLVFTLEKKIDTITTQVDTVYIGGEAVEFTSFRAYYPQKEDWFISYYGRLRDTLVYGNWDFQDLTLHLVQTETSAGLTKVYLSGPEWIKANEVSVMTAEKPEPVKFSRFWIGGGWANAYDNSWRTPTFKAAVDIKRKFLVNGTLGAGYYELGLLYGL